MGRWFRIARVRVSVACVFLLVFAGSAAAQSSTLSPALQKGVAWLDGQVQGDGSLANESTSVATPPQAREESTITLTLLAQAPSALLAGIAASTDNNIEP